MRILVWLVRAALFFALFAFALNNQHAASVKWLFGQEWRAPVVFIVLIAFGFGCAFGVLAMLPSWWQHRRAASRYRDVIDEDPGQPAPSQLLPHETHPPRNEF
jgi:uncharacterized integral membrane protein